MYVADSSPHHVKTRVSGSVQAVFFFTRCLTASLIRRETARVAIVLLCSKVCCARSKHRVVRWYRDTNLPRSVCDVSAHDVYVRDRGSLGRVTPACVALCRGLRVVSQCSVTVCRSVCEVCSLLGARSAFGSLGALFATLQCESESCARIFSASCVESNQQWFSHSCCYR